MPFAKCRVVKESADMGTILFHFGHIYHALCNQSPAGYDRGVPQRLERLIFEEYDEGFIFRLARNFPVMNFVFLLAVHNNKSILFNIVIIPEKNFLFCESKKKQRQEL
jgi:hypothetical protein